jgi:hypothetical protein
MRMAMLLVTGWTLASVLYAVGTPLVVVVSAMALSGAGIALFEVWWITALAERIPPHKLSRVTSYDWMVSAGLLPLGYVIAGPLAERIGAVEVLIVGSAAGFVCLLAALLSREVRMLPRLERTPAGAPPAPERPHIP